MLKLTSYLITITIIMYRYPAYLNTIAALIA